jgi:hypothetical protein
MRQIVNLEVTKRNSALYEMAKKKQFTDTIFHCSEGELVYAHRLILIASSIYFMDLEKRKNELKELVIYIPAFSKHSVDSLMQLFYNGTVVIENENAEEFQNLMIFFRIVKKME